MPRLEPVTIAVRFSGILCYSQSLGRCYKDPLLFRPECDNRCHCQKRCYPRRKCLSSYTEGLSTSSSSGSRLTLRSMVLSFALLAPGGDDTVPCMLLSEGRRVRGKGAQAARYCQSRGCNNESAGNARVTCRSGLFITSTGKVWRSSKQFRTERQNFGPVMTEQDSFSSMRF